MSATDDVVTTESDDALSVVQKLSRADKPDPTGVLLLAILLPVVAFFNKVAEGIGVLLDVFIVPVRVLIASIGEFVLALIGGAADILAAASGTSAQALRTGIFAQLGPFTFWIGLFVVLGAAYMTQYYLEQEETSDLIPFSATDFPFIGQEEEP